MKKIILSLVLAVAAGVIFATPVFADDFTMTIDNNQATKNQEFVFQYHEIAPGFSADAPINIINQANSSAEVKLIKIEEIGQPVAPKPAPANNMLPYVQLSLVREGGVTIAQGTTGSSSNLLGATVCVPAETTEILTTHFELPTKVGNEAQNTSLWARYTFQITVGPCSVVAPTAPDNGGSAVRPPNTSETMLPFLVIGGTFTAAFFVALIFALLLLIPLLRRRKNDKKFARKY